MTKELCKQCKAKVWETECYEHFVISGRSMFSTKNYKIPKYCKFKKGTSPFGVRPGK